LPLLLLTLWMFSVVNASADVGILGGTTFGPSHPMWGTMLGISSIPLWPPGFVSPGIEWEWTSRAGDNGQRIHTRSWNLPLTFGSYSLAVYGTIGATRWSERVAGDQVIRGGGQNVGGGLKNPIPGLGPTMIRIDYRYVKLTKRTTDTHFHRLYVGMGLGF
jgi:hypothetical protein